MQHSEPGVNVEEEVKCDTYHYVREAVAKGEVVTAYIPSEYNPSDILSKVLPGGEKRDYQVEQILRDI